MHFPDLWYFESVLRSWINANVSMGSQCSLVPKGTTNGQFRASSSTTKCDLLPTMNRTVTLSFRNVSMRRHLVKFAATVAANLVQTLAWNQNPNCSFSTQLKNSPPSSLAIFLKLPSVYPIGSRFPRRYHWLRIASSSYIQSYIFKYVYTIQ